MVRILFYSLPTSIAQNTFVKDWDHRYGGTGGDEVEIFQQTSDRGYILGGTSESGMNGDKTQASQGGADFWIVKTDLSGNKLWDKQFGGLLQEELHALQQTNDGGYILGGFSNSINYPAH